MVVDGQIVLTGTPGSRDWLANLRVHPAAVLHLRHPARDLAVAAKEVTDPAERRRLVVAAHRVQRWYASQALASRSFATFRRDTPGVSHHLAAMDHERQ